MVPAIDSRVGMERWMMDGGMLLYQVKSFASSMLQDQRRRVFSPSLFLTVGQPPETGE